MPRTLLGVAVVAFLFTGVAQAGPNAFSPDGKVQVVAEGGNISLLDAATGKIIFKAVGHKGDVTALAFSPDGKQIASGGADFAVVFWDARSGKQLRRLTGTNTITLLTYSADGRQLVTRDKDKVTRTFDVVSGAEIKKDK